VWSCLKEVRRERRKRKRKRKRKRNLLERGVTRAARKIPRRQGEEGRGRKKGEKGVGEETDKG
jgi:hypothetical protein